MNDFLLFGVLPYLSIVLFLVVTIQRYRQRRYTYSSLSSQFLENKQHFWGSVPFHYGLLLTLGGHIGVFLLPEWLLAWNSLPVRLILLEITGLGLALLTLVGLINILIRRIKNSKIRLVTTIGDWIVYALLLVQVLSGVGIAIFHSWGSSWFATSATPWLWSLIKLSPDVTAMAAMPHLVKLHVVNAFLLIAIFPFTRLVHVLVIPNPYLWRKTQVVLWNWDRRSIRKSEAGS